MKKIAIGFVAVFLIAALGVGGFAMYKITGPEFVLMQVRKDVESRGYMGLKPHMTDDAWNLVERTIDLTESTIIAEIFASVGEMERISFFKEKIGDVTFEVNDVLRGKEQSSVIIGFSYEDSVKGEIPITMVREDHTWKISGLGTPSFEKFFDYM